MKTLICIRECEIIDVGSFKVGDKVTDEMKVLLLEDHPYFEESKEDK